ncbi:MAG: hypothetical protein NVS3B20_00360 [Polyangiales bacterium]
MKIDTVLLRSFGHTLFPAALAMGACSSSAVGNSESPTCQSVMKVERFKELIIVDDSVIRDARTLNAKDGAWSFRSAMERAAPAGQDAGDFTLSWLQGWVASNQLNSYPLDRVGEERADAMQQRIICPWLQMTPENGCNATCSTCVSKRVDLAKAPFRLLAIANRMDLREKPDSAAPAGEGRLVFGLTDGPADEAASKARPMTVILEYGLPSSKGVKQWASAWHALGTFKDFGDDYKASLQNITDAFTGRGAQPGKHNGSALAQVRTNESTLDWIWQLRQFELGADGELHLAPTSNTPHESFNNSGKLRDFIVANADSLKHGTHLVPAYMLGGSVDALQYTWAVPGVDETARKAFARETCNGCHTSENTSVDIAFHVSPFKSGVEKLSRFLNNPEDVQHDELARREALQKLAACEGK